MLLNYVMVWDGLMILGRGLLESFLVNVIVGCSSCMIILDILGGGAALFRFIHDDGRLLDETCVDLLGWVCLV